MKKRVVGKELIISHKLIKKLLVGEYGKRVSIQDIWQDESTKDIHIKVAAIVSSKKNQYVEVGLEEIVNPAEYPVKEKIDDRLNQLIQSSNILNRDW